MPYAKPFAAGPAVRPWRWVIIASVLLIGGAAIAWAQDATDSPAPPPDATSSPATTEGIPTVAELFMQSPYINFTILGLSVIAVVLFLYLLLFLANRSFTPPRFVDDVTKLIMNRHFDQATHLCQTHSGLFISSIVQRMLENRDKDHAVLMEILAVEGRRRAELIWNRISILAEISNIAPMLGLLGTVIGMIKVFFTLTKRIVGQQATELAGGIAEAMGTTMFGLIVAIAAAAFYAIAKGRATASLAEAEQVCHTIADQTYRAAADPRLKKIDALAEAARQKIAQAAAAATRGSRDQPDA